MNNVKDTTFLVGSPTIEGNTTTFILKNGKYLADAFHFLPHGRINKTETGIGATTLELESKRHSIIVQPLKVTASSKADKKKNSLYVGGKTGNRKTETTLQQIITYVLNPNIPYKKIIVVADRLKSVIEAIGKSVYTDYFLLIDEIDSVQTNSTYRSTMETCIEYYKKFDNKKRALVSATLLTFSDSVLESEPLTIYKYEFATKKRIDIIFTRTIEGTTVDKIEERLNNINPKEKIVIAYNTVEGCISLAETLIKDSIISKDDIKILCSRGQIKKLKVKPYYAEPIKDRFPARVNFTTSAYFNGFDIEEKYHLIIVSDVNRLNRMLSEHDIIQISGRCRLGLSSLSLIHNSFLKSAIEEFTNDTKEDAIEAATEEIKGFGCFMKAYSRSKLLLPELKRIREHILTIPTKQTFKFVKFDLLGNLTYSFLNIDAFLEKQRVKNELYNTTDALQNALAAKDFIGTSQVKNSNREIVSIKKEKEDYKTIAAQAVEIIKNTPDSIFTEAYIAQIGDFDRKTLIYETYYKYKDLINRDNLLLHLEKYGSGSSEKGINKLEKALMFYTQEDSSQLKRTVTFYFPKGKMPIEQLGEKTQKVKDELPFLPIFKNLNEKTSKSLIKSWVEIRKTTTSVNGMKEDIYIVVGYNPLRFVKTDNILKTS